jgi:hypothetical protein
MLQNANELAFNKNYEAKIIKKINISSEEAKGINDMIIILNYSFLKQNNFFVYNFNKKTINTVCKGYNQLKTNILTPNIYELFDSITNEQLKSFRFILNNFITNFETIINDNENTELCGLISKESLSLCSKKITEHLKTL